MTDEAEETTLGLDLLIVEHLITVLTVDDIVENCLVEVFQDQVQAIATYLSKHLQLQINHVPQEHELANLHEEWNNRSVQSSKGFLKAEHHLFVPLVKGVEMLQSVEAADEDLASSLITLLLELSYDAVKIGHDEHPEEMVETLQPADPHTFIQHGERLEREYLPPSGEVVESIGVTQKDALAVFSQTEDLQQKSAHEVVAVRIVAWRHRNILIVVQLLKSYFFADEGGLLHVNIAADQPFELLIEDLEPVATNKVLDIFETCFQPVNATTKGLQSLFEILNSVQLEH
jgi:hypothetical protein